MAVIYEFKRDAWIVPAHDPLDDPDIIHLTQALDDKTIQINLGLSERLGILSVQEARNLAEALLTAARLAAEAMEANGMDVA